LTKFKVKPRLGKGDSPAASYHHDSSVQVTKVRKRVLKWMIAEGPNPYQRSWRISRSW